MSGNVFERAFELAEGGRLPNLEAIRNALAREGFHNADDLLSGAYIRGQLERAIEQAADRALSIVG